MAKDYDRNKSAQFFWDTVYLFIICEFFLFVSACMCISVFKQEEMPRLKTPQLSCAVIDRDVM